MSQPSFRFALESMTPRTGAGGVTRGALVSQFPACVGIAGVSMRLAPGAMRGLHWHANADEWQYYLEGSAEMSVFLAEGHVVTEPFVAGDIVYAPMWTGHYIRNTGAGMLRVLIGFNCGDYQANDLSAWLATNPVDVLATNLGLPRDKAEALCRRPRFLTPHG